MTSLLWAFQVRSLEMVNPKCLALSTTLMFSSSMTTDEMLLSTPGGVHLGIFWVGMCRLGLQIAHFTVTVGNEAGVDLVLIQPCLLCYVNHVFVILNSIFKQNLH